MNTVNPTLTPNRRTSAVENDDYAAFLHRIIAAYARRIAAADVEALPQLLALAELIDTTITDAVLNLRACGYSWAEIAARVGITRQAAQQRWGGER